MKIFCDYIGHADLDYSMHMLFEERLGAQVLRPNSQCWLEILGRSKDYPLHAPFPPGPGEIVVPHYMPQFSMPDCKKRHSFIGKDQYLNIEVPTHNYYQKFISWEQFQSIDFDLLITTYWGNESIFHWMQKELCPKSRLIRQIANIHERPKIIRNIMLATDEPLGENFNAIKYYPEHPSVYCPGKPQPNRKIKSFWNNVTVYQEAMTQWTQLRSLLPEYDFKQYGMNNPDGSIPQAELPDAMRDAMFIWHSKPHGCCGYVAREALACGKPIIANKRYAHIHNTLAKHYLVDGVNCIDVDPAVRTVKQAVEILRDWSRPDMYEHCCNRVISHYRDTINFANEAQRIKTWLDQMSEGT